MIVVVVGTNPYSFDRLIESVEAFALESGEAVFAQLGSTTYVPHGVESVAFLPHEELRARIEKADLVISHGGFGSLAECLSMGKRVVAVPRRTDLGEAADPGEGQIELVRALAQAGRVVALYDVSKLAEAIAEARSRRVRPSEKGDAALRVRKFLRQRGARRVCLVASGGGHLWELLALGRSLSGLSCFVVTARLPHIGSEERGFETFKIVDPHRSLWGYLKATGASARLFLRERPDAVVTTGAGMAIPMCLIAKLFRRPLVFVESGARVESPSRTGRLLHRIADLTIVQWRQLLRHYPRAVPGGLLF